MSSWELPSRRTIHDLHLERDAISWYFRAVATASSWLILAGYIIFPLAFTSKLDNLHANSTTLTAFAACLLIIGYVLIVILYLIVKSWLFQLDEIFIPMLTSSALGLFTILLSLTLHQNLRFASVLVYIPLIVSTISTITSAFLALYKYRRILMVKRRVDRSRSHRETPRDPRDSWPQVADDTSTANLISHLPEDELQRQQLLRLLLKRDGDRAPSPDAMSTYRIDIPSTTTSPTETRYLSVPPGASKRNRSDSAEVERPIWPLQNLRNLFPGASRNRDREVEMATSKSLREKRREEIERGDSPGPSSAVYSETPSFPPPPQQWKRTTRYA